MSKLSLSTDAGQADDLAAKLSAPFDPTEVKFKPAVVSGNRALAMPYINARCVMDRLDDVLGVDGWQDSYSVLSDGSVICRLRVLLSDRWIVKADVGGQSEQPDEGDRVKAAFSDALKRAAVKYGIGRYLYRLPAQWVDYDPQKRQFVRLPTLPVTPVKSRPKEQPQKEKDVIGPDGARKLENLATRKGVTLDSYLEAADISQFQSLSDLAPEQARQIWRTLSALPDCQSAASSHPGASVPSAATVNNGNPNKFSTSRVPF
jgi:hypothetical protein